MNFYNIIRALKAGNELSDPAKWKNRQNTTTAVGTMIAVILAFVRARYPDFSLPMGAEEHIVEGIVVALGLANIYWTTATTKKIGAK